MRGGGWPHKIRGGGKKFEVGGLGRRGCDRKWEVGPKKW